MLWVKRAPLGEGRSNRRSSALLGTGEDRIERARDGGEPHHHPGATAEGGVIGALAPFEGVEEVVVANRHEPGLDGTADDREADVGREDLGEEGDDVDSEHAASFGVRGAAASTR